MLIVLLPLQSGWAAIAGTCADSGRVDAVHLGHHAHGDSFDTQTTELGVTASASIGDDGSTGKHLDCPTCHGIGVAVPVDFSLPPEGTAREPNARFVPPSQPQAPPGDVLRPPTSHFA